MIKEFRGEYRFLSNFAPSSVELDGVRYPTTEHAFQAAKTDDLMWREEIRVAPTPGKAKALGRRVPKRDDWDKVRVSVMKGLLDQKFALDTVEGRLLLATDEQELVEGNTWGDTFWGVCNGVGENWLGRLLMQRRSELRDQQKRITGKNTPSVGV